MGSGASAVFVIPVGSSTVFTEVTNLPDGATTGGLAATDQYAYVTNIPSSGGTGSVMLISPTSGYVKSVSLPANSVPYAIRYNA